MNLKKTYTAWLTLALLLVLTAAILTGCKGNSDGVTEIFVQPSQAPRLTYVQGQELDLSRGVLTVSENGEQRSIPLNNEGITVSGYDPNLLGKQTLTVTYMDMTTTIEVTVIARVLAENYETDYFVGDTFDSSKGRLRIARDDGSTFNVNLNSETVTLKSFDPSAAGSATVTVAYSDGKISCDCTFTVTVHQPDEVTLTPPKQTDYASHETELNLSGGYLTVRAAAPSTFSKFVNLTPEMVSGYDPTKATVENLYEPLTQTVTITYAGKTFEFTVNVTYSSVFLVKDAAKELASLDWTGETVPEHSLDQGLMAAEALLAYMDLSPADRAHVTQEELMAVARPGTVYLNTLYNDIAATFADAFEINSQGYVNIVGNSYQAIADAVTHLNNPDHDFNVIASALNDIREEFSQEILYGTLPFASAISSHNEDSIAQITVIFEFMLTISDALNDVPADWTVESLKNHEIAIETAVSKILLSNYKGMDYNYFYVVVSSWRENDDYFDIIYSYYFYVKENGREEILSTLWNNLPAPGILNDWYMAYVRALTEANTLNKDASTVFLYDASGLMYYYAEAQKQAEILKSSGNQLYLDLYAYLEGDTALDVNVRRAAHGYIYQMGEALGLASVESVWNAYIELLDVFLNDTSNYYETQSEKFEAVFAAMDSLTPAELHTFLSTVNYLYDSTPGDTLVLDCAIRPYNVLANLLATYYRGVLPSDALDSMFLDLLVAMENASLYGIKPTAVTDLGNTLTKIETAYGKLSASDKDVFDTRFGASFSKYKALYAAMNAQSVTVPSGYADKFDELNDLLNSFDRVYAFILSGDRTDVERSRMTPLVFALYERIYRVYGELAYCGDQAVVTALTAKGYTADNVTYTLGSRFLGARTLFVNLMISSGLSDGSGNSEMTWDVYRNANISEFLGDIAYLMLAEFDGKAYTGSDLTAIMASFRGLTNDQQVSFYRMSVNLLYYAAIERTCVATMGEDAREAVKALLDAEIAYVMYAYDGNADALKDFNTNMAALADKHASVVASDSFKKLLGGTYDHYKALYQA